ncbi:DUF1207 domain-containing protein [Chlamydiales bacterium]|nr:DUF1207 domain-containing protein [Chlamydiales bacterium]
MKSFFNWITLGIITLPSLMVGNEYHTPTKLCNSMPSGCCYPIEDECEEYICIENSYYQDLNPCCLRGVWLPEAPPLFLPLKADPRQLIASVGSRFHDDVFGTYVVDVSYFDTAPIYRWFNAFFSGDQLQLDLDGALWAIFQPMKPSSPLVNADYYGGISLNYSYKCWSFRLRGFHISSHIGDEFLIDHPDFDRKNPSAEYIDLIASYNVCDDLRFYAGAGYIPHSDPTFAVRSLYAQGGAELYLPWFRFISFCNMLEGRPFFAMNFALWENNEWDLDQTYVIGYEVGKLYGLERKLRLYAEYHDGFSCEGQFCKYRTSYVSLRVSYGF